MAAADYYSCDVCGRKTFYDADLEYTSSPPDYEPVLPGVGAMKVICTSCADSHEVVIVPRPASRQKDQPHD